MTTSKPYVSVIIPVYNDAVQLTICLESLQNQSYPTELFEVIVIDNGSNKSVETITRGFSRVITSSELRKGSYAARNKGITLAKGEILAFTDSDCRPSRDWIANGVENLKSTANCGLLGGNIKLFYNNPLKLSAVEVYESVVAFQQRNYIENLHYGATANVFTYRNVFKRVGVFNPELKSGGDREWGNRVYAAGYVQKYAEDVCVLHPARRTFRELYKKTTRVSLGLKDRKINTLIKSYTRMLFFFPHEQITMGLSNKNLSNFQKIQFLAVMFFVKYTMAWQKTRLLFGAEPKR